MPEEQTHILREHFLEAFVRDLIISSYDPSKDEELQKELESQKLLGIKNELENNQGMPMINLSNLEPKNQPFPVPQSETASAQTIQPVNFTAIPKPSMVAAPHQNYQPVPQVNAIPLPQEMYNPQLKQGQKPDTINLGKIASMLVDPTVISIECPGPYKNVLVNRSGMMQTSAITLTPEEITAIMQNVSEKTRIPLTGGVFKAAVQNLLVTAVISDFVGTRFLVQKRSPFQKY